MVLAEIRPARFSSTGTSSGWRCKLAPLNTGTASYGGTTHQLTVERLPGAVDAHVHQCLDAPTLNLQMDRTRLQQVGLSAFNVGQNVPLQTNIGGIAGLAGAAAGSLGGGSLADRLGRKGSFMLCALPMLVGPLLSAAATSLEMMVAGRAVAGLAIGLSSALVPVYIAEVAPTAQRGTFGALNQLLICLGILAALLVNVEIGRAHV